MSLSKDVKAKIVAENARAANDTGSAEVQIALLSARIDGLQPHFAKNPKDNHGHRGLMKLVSQRRSMLDYLKRRDEQRYKALIAKLGLRR